MYSETTVNYLIAFLDIKDSILTRQPVIEIARDREINSVMTILRADKQNDTKMIINPRCRVSLIL